MNTETLLGCIIAPILFIMLLVLAYYLDKRAKAKGDLITGEKHTTEPGARLKFYLGLLIMMIVTAIGCWGVYINSWLLIIIGSVFIGITYVAGHLMHAWELIHFSQKALERDKDNRSH